MSWLYFAHLMIVFAFLSLPFLPLKYLKYGVYVPIVLTIIWLVFDGCPISFAQPELKGESKFTLHIILLTTLAASMRLWKLKR